MPCRLLGRMCAIGARRHLTLVACCMLLAGAERPQPQNLKIMVEDAAEPFSGSDGTGYANDIVRAAFLAVGIFSELDVVPYARCKRAVETGRTPACFSMSWMDALAGRVAFSDHPIFAVRADYYQRATKPLPAATELDIPPGSRIGIINGYEYPEGVEALKLKGVVLEEAESNEINLKKLAAGHLDGAIVMTNDLEPRDKTLVEAEFGGKLDYAFSSGTMQSFIGFSRVHAQGDWARTQFNMGYELIKRNGTVDAIRRHWISELGK